MEYKNRGAECYSNMRGMVSARIDGYWLADMVAPFTNYLVYIGDGPSLNEEEDELIFHWFTNMDDFYRHFEEPPYGIVRSSVDFVITSYGSLTEIGGLNAEQRISRVGGD
jgi:hypothetical protein